MQNAQERNKQIYKRLENIKSKVFDDIIEISYRAGVGHIGSSLSCLDVLIVLYEYVLHIDSKRPLDSNRDRFILSKGHAASALYPILQRKGFFSRKKLLSFCQNGGAFGVHPVFERKYGIEFSTGSLGHGLPVGVGMAYGLRQKKGKNPKVFVLLSDGELNEGSTWEAIMFAAHHKLSNIVAIVDINDFQAFGRTQDVLQLTPYDEKWRSFGWDVKNVDGHDIPALIDAFDGITFEKDKPRVILAHTKIGKGIKFFEGKQEAHYHPLNKSQYEFIKHKKKERSTY